MKILSATAFVLFATATAHAVDLSIDTSIVFKCSRTYLDIKKRSPGQRLLLMEDSSSPEWVQVAIVEDHPTHVVRLATLRVHGDGRIERLILDDDGEEAWRPDGRAGKSQSEQGVAPQSATRSESDSEGGDKPQPESKPRPR